MISGAWTPKALPGTAAPDSALPAAGAVGKTRLYYIDAQHHVYELAWQTNKFVNTLCTRPRAARRRRAPIWPVGCAED